MVDESLDLSTELGRSVTVEGGGMLLFVLVDDSLDLSTELGRSVLILLLIPYLDVGIGGVVADGVGIFERFAALVVALPLLLLLMLLLGEDFIFKFLDRILSDSSFARARASALDSAALLFA